MKRGIRKTTRGDREVAVKMLLPGSTRHGTSEEDTVRFLQEAAIMGQFRHPNIIQLLGVVTVGEPVSTVRHYISLILCCVYSADDCA